MTIACCYVTTEGVVFGADSTTSYSLANGPHYFNHAQKLFEVGNGSTLGIVTWGLGGLMSVSYRTLFAQLGDDLEATPPASVKDAADRWIALFDNAVKTSAHPDLKAAFAECAALGMRPMPGLGPNALTPDELQYFQQLRRELTVGFCIGGRTGKDRAPAAWFMLFDPGSSAATKPTEIPVNGYRFWGAPNMVQRLIFGADEEILPAIAASGKWSGTPQELQAIFASKRLSHPVIPLREAVDFVHFCIHSTIKALKFSDFSQICGGPIELAVISTDRQFRWIHHKGWDAAVVDGALP